MEESRKREETEPMSMLMVRQERGVTLRPAVPGARRWYHRCRTEHVLVGCGVALLPWLVVLAKGLPATTTAAHWNTAWVGLDSLEATGLIATGLLAARGHPLHALTASATATLLVADAWFDTMTAAPGGDQLSALAMAFGAELPLAALCGALAVRGLARRTA
ncbi:hypothetical protein ACFY1U_16755 [Streptomyces sp. NPDC001351]|uniref:hypothetical protein n=1 Tax=Streptomyces sp. NPDC001351 TaxID=3364564 RepID=UPI0036BBE73D